VNQRTQCTDSTALLGTAHSRATRRWLISAALAILLCTGLSSQAAATFELYIDAPIIGQFTESTTVTVVGRVVGPQASIATLEVNGQTITNLAADGSWSIDVSLDPATIFQAIQADLTATDNSNHRELVTIISGPSVSDGERTESGAALRLNDDGLEVLAGTVTGDLEFDIDTLLPPSTVLISNYCYSSIFGFCLGTISAVVAPNPPPSISGFATELDSRTDIAHADIALNDLFVNVDIFDTSGLLGISCTLTIIAPLMRLGADMTIQPDASDPKYVDVIQQGSITSAFVKLSNDAGCSGFLSGFIESYVEDSASDTIQTEVTNLMNSLDADGNTPIAAAFETALDTLEIASAIGAGLGLTVDAVFNSASIDEDGTTLDLDIAFWATTPDPNAADLTASLTGTSLVPTYSAKTPAGATYDLAVGVSTGGFNSLLTAETVKGLLRTSITEITLLEDPIPLTAGLLSFFDGAFRDVDPITMPLRFDVAPVLAPVITGADGAFGELAELQLAHLLMTIRADDGSDTEYLSLAIDLQVGLDPGLNSEGELSFTLGELDPENLGVVITHNPLGVDEANFTILMLDSIPLLFPDIAASLASFPVPSLAGLTFSFVEASKQGDFLSLFLSVPKIQSRHAVLFDGDGVVVYASDPLGFSEGHYVQDVPASFETGSGGSDDQLGLYGNRKGVLSDGAEVTTYDFSPIIGFTQTAVTQAFADLPADFENGVDAGDNALDFPLSNLAVLYNGDHVSLHNWNGISFSGSRTIQGIPSGFESGAAGQDNNLMFIDASTAWLWDGGTVKSFRFDPRNGFEFVENIQGAPDFFETSSNATDNLLAYTMAAPSDPSAADTCTAVLYDGVVVRVYDFDNIHGFTNMRYVQGTPEGFEWESPQNKDTHLGFYSPTQAVYVTSQNVKLYNFNKHNGFSYVSETTQNTACVACPPISEVGDDALDNVFDFLDSNRAVEFNGQNVILYDRDGQLLTNAQIIQGTPPGFETGAGATGNHLAFANPSQAVYFDGSDVQLYDFDITNGFTNPQTIQGTPSEFENGVDATENVLSILPGCTQPPPPLCTGDESTGDTDGDGTCDDIDPCPNDAYDDSDGDGSCDSVDLCIGDDISGDTDIDGVCDDTDTCPSDANDDSDGDGSCDSVDLCIGDDISGDTDIDGVCDDTDACPIDPYNDSDGDGSCDSADFCTGDDTSGDTDGDGACDDSDAFPGDPTETADSDGDGIGDDEELASGTDPHDSDSDDDGHSDLVEKNAGSDPLDSSSVPGSTPLPSLTPFSGGLLVLLLAGLGTLGFQRRGRQFGSSDLGGRDG
jgi:hypothetical protein